MSSANFAAVWKKIANVLAARPQCFVTHPSELGVLKSISAAELETFARERGWRVVSRIGGRQIEFYNDVSATLSS